VPLTLDCAFDKVKPQLGFKIRQAFSTVDAMFVIRLNMLEVDLQTLFDEVIEVPLGAVFWVGVNRDLLLGCPVGPHRCYHLAESAGWCGFTALNARLHYSREQLKPVQITYEQDMPDNG